MAILKNPLFTLSGKLGDVVFRKYPGGKIVVARLPRKRKPATGHQAAMARRFGDAVRYANTQMADPASKAEYAARISKKKLSAHAVAMSDYLRAPQIYSIDTSAYQGRAGDIITIRAHDDFKVTAVRVAITNNTGRILERGNAVLDESKVDAWQYTAKHTNSSPALTTIIAVAQDKPGNATIETKVLG